MKRELTEKVIHIVENNTNELIEILQQLVRIPSVNPPGKYDEIADLMVQFYKAEGLAPVVASAPRTDVEKLGLAYPRPNVIARCEGKDHNPVFCLDAHMDVVGADDDSSWTHPPFGAQIYDSKIFGRGTADTKAHLAAQLIAFRAVREAGIPLKGDLILASTVDDEIGQWPGIGYLMEKGFEAHGFRRPQYHIAGEPSGIENVWCLARGRMWYDITIKGRPAHGGSPDQGVNAIEKAISLASAIKMFPIRTHPLMGSDTINLGILQGGEVINVVPSSCRITFDIRPTTKNQVVKDFVDRAIQELKKEDPDFEVSSMALLNDREPSGIGPDHEFVKTIQRVTKEITGKSVVATGGLSLGNAYWSYINGVASVLWGGGHMSRVHKSNEFISVDELVEITKVFAGLIVELCA